MRPISLIRLVQSLIWVLSVWPVTLASAALAQPLSQDPGGFVLDWAEQFRQGHSFLVEWKRAGAVRDKGSEQSWNYDAAEMVQYSWPEFFRHETKILTDTTQNYQVLGGVKDRLRGIGPDGIGYSTDPGNKLMHFRGATSLEREVWEHVNWAPWLLAFHYRDADARQGLQFELKTEERAVAIDSVARRRLGFERVGAVWRLVRVAIVGQDGEEVLWTNYSDFRSEPHLGTDVAYSSQIGGRSMLRGGEVLEHPAMPLVRLEFLDQWPSEAFAPEPTNFATVDPETGELIAAGGVPTGIKYGRKRMNQAWRFAALAGIVVAGSAVGIAIWIRHRR
ncbi:MAG: hypothetical protein IPJ41_05565 [Phycisphaerales bacterium]|nr:hypothetical protein [Phycisphaerales bacterium]